MIEEQRHAVVRRRHAACTAVVASLALGTISCSRPEAKTNAAVASTDGVMTVVRTVRVTRPTVIAYFVVPPGAVDTMPNLAVETDDWNVSMAQLSDSLEAGGIGFAMTTEPAIEVEVDGGVPTSIALGQPLTAGYVFVRPGAPATRCRGGMDQADVLAMAKASTVSPKCEPIQR